MRIDLIFPVLPPALDGIGDHTAHLAAALAAQDHTVRVWTAQTDPAPIPGVSIERTFTCSPRHGVRDVVPAVAADPPDWLVLQYNPFSYGRWGLNLSLPGVLTALRQQCPDMRIALMVHEPFVPVESWRFAVFTLWQRWQLWRLGQSCDALFVAIAPWVDRFQSWFPQVPVIHLPVGSNIPYVSTDRTAIRSTLGLDPETFVLGLFGSGHASRLLPFVHQAAAALRTDGQDPTVLYIGAADQNVNAALGSIRTRCVGALPGPEVSRHFAAMDLYLAPFRKGVSTRRGSFLVGLQHGIATVSTVGIQTDPLLRRHNNHAFVLSADDDPGAFAAHVTALAHDPERRARTGTDGRMLFESTFAWPRLAEALTDALHSHTPASALASAAAAPPSA